MFWVYRSTRWHAVRIATTTIANLATVEHVSNKERRKERMTDLDVFHGHSKHFSNRKNNEKEKKKKERERTVHEFIKMTLYRVMKYTNNIYICLCPKIYSIKYEMSTYNEVKFLNQNFKINMYSNLKIIMWYKMVAQMFRILNELLIIYYFVIL